MLNVPHVCPNRVHQPDLTAEGIYTPKASFCTEMLVSDHQLYNGGVVPALSEFSLTDDAEPEEFVVGRVLGDEIRLSEIEEAGEDVWSVTDADSAGLESAWASMLDETGEIRTSEFEPFDSVVYLYGVRVVTEQKTTLRRNFRAANVF
jgi:hypothetical protein